MANRVVPSYAAAVAALEELSDEAERLGDFDEATALDNQRLALEKWLNGDQSEPCPVELAHWQIELPPDGHRPAAVQTPLALDRLGAATIQETPPVTDSPPLVAPRLSPPPGDDQKAMPETDDLAVVEEAPEESIVETPEQADLRRQLEQARLLLDQGALREAFALSRFLQQPLSGTRLEQTAADLYQRASLEFNRQLDQALAAGDEARAGGSIDAARQHYESALQLDLDNSHARHAILELNQTLSQQLSDAENLRLRRNLANHRDLQQLGDAVYLAEALQAEGKLDDEFAELLREARQAYDEGRLAHGAETTMMRFGDLTARAEAVQKISDRVTLDEKKIFDVTTNRWRPSFELLEEANKLHEDGSAITLQYESDRIRQALETGHPRLAKKRLLDSLEKPFLPQHRRMLEGNLENVEAQILNQDQAEERLADADRAEDPLAAFKLTLRAQSLFPGLQGIATRVAQARQTALGALLAQMEERHRQARAYLLNNDFKQAHEAIAAAEALPADWPEEKLPALITALAAGETIRQLVNEREALQHEFDKSVSAIRQHVLDADHRQAGLQLLEELRNDQRFKEFSQLRALNAEMDQYKDIGAQIVEAQEARTQGDWQRVHDLTTTLKKSGKAGDLGPQVKALLEEAEQELAITQARDYLEVHEFGQASRLLKNLLEQASDKTFRSALEERLKWELDKIEQVKRDTPPMRDLTNHAAELRQKKGVAERIEALHLFRYAGGLSVTERREEWPEYRPSLGTATARKAAGELRVELREDVLIPLQKAYAERAAHPPEGDRLRTWATEGRALREAHLLESEDERAVARWLEVAQGSVEARGKEANADWDGAVAIWRDLNTHHPRVLEVESGLRAARVQQAIGHAARLRHQGQNESALQELRTAQQEPGLQQAWEIHQALAEVHAARGEFVQAFDALRQAESYLTDKTALAHTRLELEKEQAIQEALSKARLALETTGPKDALETLQMALGKELTRESRRLIQLRAKIFDEARATLLKKAAEEKARGGDEGKIQAVVALVDLRQLEDVMALPSEERRSLPGLEPLRAELAPVAVAVVKEARDFEPSNFALEQALTRAGQLSSRLATFSSIIPLFDELVSVKENLKARQAAIELLHQRLKRLHELLQEANQSTLWERALRLGDFSALEQYGRQIGELDDLSAMLEVGHFRLRLEEWREIHADSLQTIAAVKQHFTGKENFAAARQLVRQSAQLTSRRKNNLPWQQVQQPEYEGIHRLMGEKLRVADLYGDATELIGWSQVGQAALAREQEVEAWAGWDAACERLMDNAHRPLAATESHSPATTLVDKRRDWELTALAASAAIEALTAGPALNDEPVPLRSQKSHNYRKEGSRRLQIARDWLSQAENEIASLASVIAFPTSDEFNNAVARKDVRRLEQLLAQARKVGAINPEEQKRIEKFEQVLKKLINPPKPSFWDKLLGRG